MGFFCVAILVLSLACSSVARSITADVPSRFSVVDYGATGDGVADDTEAFVKAWAFTCGADSGLPTMVVPSRKTYFVRPTIFKGPCKSKNVSVQLEGTIVAPESTSIWNGIDATLWLHFESIRGLTVSGPGEINGRGQNWWKQSCRYNSSKDCIKFAPTAVKFRGCTDLRVSNLKSVDSAQTHFLVEGGVRVLFDHITIKAPGDSPNTDGIHIHDSQHVTIQNSAIGTGDDCISIGSKIYDVNINHISCGPGHGISIGSLGVGRSEGTVEEVHVKYVDFYGTTNGARIKTWQGAIGYAKGISYEHCNFTDVQNPITIDQYYCDVPGNCKNEATGVKISNVRYANLQGTSSTNLAISLNCSQAVPCTAMTFDTVDLRPSGSGAADTQAHCINAFGDANGDIHPSLSCLSH